MADLSGRLTNRVQLSSDSLNTYVDAVERAFGAAAASLHFAHYNFVRLHRTTRVTPAMPAGVSDRLWSLEELVERTTS